MNKEIRVFFPCISGGKGLLLKVVCFMATLLMAVPQGAWAEDVNTWSALKTAMSNGVGLLYHYIFIHGYSRTSDKRCRVAIDSTLFLYNE